MQARDDAARSRAESDIGRFEQRRGVKGGALVFKGTRIPVAGIVAYLNGGYSVAEVLANFPDLDARDIAAALATRRPSAID